MNNYLTREQEDLIISYDSSMEIFTENYLHDLAKNTDMTGQELYTAAFGWYLRDLVDELEDISPKLRTNLGWDKLYLQARQMLDALENLLDEEEQSKYWDSRTLSVITLEELQKRYMNGDAWRKMSFAEYLGNLLKEDDGDINLFTLNEAYKMYSNDIENDIGLWKESCDAAGCEPTSFQGMEIYHKYYAEGIELTMDIVHDIVKEM